MTAKTSAGVSVAVLAAMFSFGCGGNGGSDSPTRPSPVPAAVSLTGTVSSTAGGSRIAGATVTILDGANSGRSATTDGSGVYGFDNLQPANGNFAAKGPGFLEDRRGVHVDGVATLDFTLDPDRTWAGGTWRGTIRSTSCSADSTFSTFCRTNPVLSDALELVLTQNGSAVSGTINVGGVGARASGSNQNGQLSITGSAPSGSVTVVYENWATTVSGASMTGGFQVRFAASSGSVRYVVALSAVSRVASGSVASRSAARDTSGQLLELVRHAGAMSRGGR